ncbi:hypothetical protein F4778DRAFT_759867 [Xylariomycetidae sp. FL2044]|nr:hypothetical protein F4778DRAFT_759867 [Xylariomycetidae sp. FL2044]
MSAEATAVMAPAPEPQPAVDHGPDHHLPDSEIKVASHPVDKHAPNNDSLKPTGLHSPPDSNSAMKLDGSDSELSDLDDPSIDVASPPPPAQPQQSEPGPADQDEEEDIGEVVPDHWSGTVPVFKPDMHQFKDFKKFMEKIDSYGMRSGIVKVIPPQEWKDRLPELDDLVKQVRVKEPIKQEIMGNNGTYRQVNILHQRSYNLPQWRQLCDQSEHQPPARRGERRAQAPAKPKNPSTSSGTRKRGGGRVTRGRGGKTRAARAAAEEQGDRPMTPVSPKPVEDVVESVERDPGGDINSDDDAPVVGRMGGSRQARPKTQSTSARRKFAKREGSAKIDEEAFKNWDYHMDISDYTPERCEELERIYWKTLTYAPPLYGADLPGTLFDDSTENWNLNKLPNLLDVLGTKVPGVNTAYLYLGMWKATFAWHLEDVDLYSINYLHFGAPKQWYSISQGDARRFEAAMKSIWPTDAKACDQFLRHKAFLISPNHLLQYFNIKVNKCVSYPGEFVVTYPYGYHSGYNLGYNCAEAVNFALDSWLPMGKIAKRCECAQAQDSVWVDVYEIERKMRGEETDYEETEDEDEEEEEEEEDADDGDVALPTPKSSVKFRQVGQKRKRATTDKGERKAKKIRLRVKNHIEPPCCLCPHDIPGAELLPTEDGRKAHRLCALYGPEIWIDTVDDKEVVANVANISKDRLDLKCLYCRSKRGACFQCSSKKCLRAYHATCAAAAGVLVEDADIPIFGEDGTEYKEQAFAFSCRFHRTKRDRKLDSVILGECRKTYEAARDVKKGQICQLQYYRGEIFAGVVVENRAEEETFLLDVIPNGDRVEVEWRWLLLPDPADFHLPRASPNAIPMPTSREAKDKINATRRQVEELPRADDPFVEGCTWAEFHRGDCTNPFQAKVDLSKEHQLWHYLGRTSTEARAQYTEDPRKRRHNAKSNFLDTLPKPPPPAPAQPRKSSGHYGSSFSMQNSHGAVVKQEKPYHYKPKIPAMPSYVPSPFTTQFGGQQFTPQNLPYTSQQFIPRPPQFSSQQFAPVQSGYVPQPPPQKPCPINFPYPTPKPAAEPTPKPPPPPKPIERGHVRSKSSISSLNGKTLAFGSDTRFRTPPSSYGSARLDTNGKSPFSHGFFQPPGLGPAPSPQNGQLFQAQARARSNSSVSSRSVDTPMTSSAIRPTSSASAHGAGNSAQRSVATIPDIARQPRPSIVQKYAFFQVHHNRDSTKYRTPYANWGGFTNGYEGNLRAHLLSSPNAFYSIRQSLGLGGGTSGLSAVPQTPSNSTAMYPSSPGSYSSKAGLPRPAHASPASGYSSPIPFTGKATSPSMTPSTPRQSEQHRLSSTSIGSWNANQGAGAQLHPAIRAHYAAMLQSQTDKIQDQSRGAQGQRLGADLGPVVSAALTAPKSPLTALPTPSLDGAQTASLPMTSASTGSSPSAYSTPAPKPANVVTGQASTKPPGPPKQTYVPPPRPWELLQKMQQPVSHHTPRRETLVATTPTTTPATGAGMATPASGATMHQGPDFSRHLSNLGPQPSHPQPTNSITSSDQQPYLQPTASSLQPPSTTSVHQPTAAVSRQQSPLSTAAALLSSELGELRCTPTPPMMEALTPEMTPVASETLPEVPEGSIELVESIIRGAQQASSFSKVVY